MSAASPRPWLAAYPAGVSPDLDSSALPTMAALLEAAFKAHAPRTAYACRAETVTFAQVDAQSQAVAAWLQRQGLAPGARVAIMLPTLLCYPVILAGILRSGFTTVCINPQYTAAELRNVLADSGAQVLFIQPDAPRPLVDAIPDGVRAVHFAQVLAEGARWPLQAAGISADSIALLQYTGGTTGVSRGAQLTHRNLVANVLQSQAWVTPALSELGAVAQYTFGCVLPLHHIFGLTACLLLGAHMGALTVLVANPFDVRGAVAQLSAWRVNQLPAVNTLFAAMMADPKFKDIDFSGLRVSIAGGMKLQPGTASRWEALTGCGIAEAYGLSETSPLVCCNPLDGRARPGTIGLPVPGTEVAILDDTGARLPADAVGEIAIRGPQVMPGYWANPQATREAINAEGFFLTGDVGAMDADGFVRVVDRKKDVINVGGAKVYPTEVEAVVMAHEAVAECACIGVPDPNTSEAVRLFVVRKPDAALTAAQVMAHCRAQLTGYKLPRQVVFLDALPRTGVGKVSRLDLRALDARAAA